MDENIDIEDPTPVTKYLNAMGADGWELVTVLKLVPGGFIPNVQRFYLKRPLKRPQKSKHSAQKAR